MVAMQDQSAGRLHRIPPLPPFLTPEEVLADVLPMLDPPSRMSVTDAAERYMRVSVRGSWQAFDRLVTPYTVEPADITQSRLFKAVCFVGPSQSGKSQMLLSTAMHAVTCSPGPVQIIHMTKTDADAWVEEKLDPTILNSPDLSERLGRAREDSTFSRKRFKGMRVSIGYPVANQLSSRSQRMVLLTDYDHMPQRLGPKDSPEGTPFMMALPRITTFMSRGCVLVESTPAFPVEDPAWRYDPAQPHLLPPAVAGIVQIYNEGTRGRWYWECPDCLGLYEPRFDRLVYDKSLDPGEAGAKAEMECPLCGGLIPHKHKVALNRQALIGRGGWLHEAARLAEDGTRPLVRIGDPAIRKVTTASYHLNGAAAAFSNWAEMVERYEQAVRRLAVSGDDIDLSRATYTDIGLPYLRPDQDADGAVTVQALRDNLRDLPHKTCPSWARFVTVSVDANGSWFAVLVTAWGLEGQRAPIDRFDLRQPLDSAPRARDSEGRYRAIDPGKYAEDAQVLRPLLDAIYPVEGADWSLTPAAMVIDFNGPVGWPDNAEKFWRSARRDGQGHRVFLSIGRGGFKLPERVWLATPERGSRGKKARSIKLLNMAVDRLKDSVLAAVARFEEGPGAYSLPRWLDEERLAELLAEQRRETGYEKRPGAVRNETLDLSVQALAVAEMKGLNRIDPEAPPIWADLAEGNPFAVWTGQGQGAPADDVPQRRVMKWLKR